jgi:plasmid stability protein
MSRQYTLRSIPSAVDEALRRRARQEGRSLNAITLEALARGLDLEADSAQYTDLDALIGSWQEDSGFDDAVATFERIDEEVWR